MPEPLSESCEACTKRAPLATSPKFQPSPIRKMLRPAAASTSAFSCSITLRGWWPIRSKRNESTRYCVAQVFTESIIKRAIIAFSVAVLLQQVDISTLPSADSRW